MTSKPKHIAVLGSTGSIGRTTLDVMRDLGSSFRVEGLSAHHQLDALVTQARQWQPAWIVATDADRAGGYEWPSLPNTRIATGLEALVELVSDPDVDLVVAAIVGSAGLTSTIAALRAGKTVALANKEVLVAAGPLVLDAAAKGGGQLVPVDSEHSAIFQAVQAGRPNEVRRVILTASGGPFRNHSLEQMARVTAAEALAHPVWDMGSKISVDSATMMNKALEIVEARWLFGLQPDQIEVVIHPQSIVHSLVEFHDGSVLAQLSTPNMRLPIQYALTYPHRLPSDAAGLDFCQAMELQFTPPDPQRFPAIELGMEVARSGGTCGVVISAANEAAVAAFLAGKIPFLDIVPACRAVMRQHDYAAQPTLDDLLRLDRWAREEMHRWMSA